MHGHKMSIVRPGTLTTDGSSVLDQVSLLHQNFDYPCVCNLSFFQKRGSEPPELERRRPKKRADYDVDLEHIPPASASSSASFTADYDFAEPTTSSQGKLGLFFW